MKLESAFKAKAKERIRECLGDDIFIHEMMCQTQGIPDTLILCGDKWALLEFKRSRNATHRPNQDYYVDMFNSMGFSAFVYPENFEDVLDDLRRYFYG